MRPEEQADVTAENGTGRQTKAGMKHHLVIAAVCSLIAVGMVGLSFAAVPLYRLYCQATGYAGTTQRVEKASGTVLDRTLTVRFDSNVAADLPWTFEPEQRKLEVKIGEMTLAFYKATNNSDHAITGTAVFNVTPEAVGLHFNKVQCFCFTEQRLEPGQTVDMAVSFFVDPEFVKDEDTKDLSELTLSYTFYPADRPKKAQGQAAVSSTDRGG
jgi:cytochrome c oxidase assembly protein subunit 11